MELLTDELRTFKHDFENMISVIDGYIKSDDMEGLKKYFSSFEKDYHEVQNLQILSTNIINDAGIHNLLVTKYKKAYNLGIKVNFEIFFDFNNLKMPVYDFSKILGILLDNAIEAANDCTYKEINIVFRDARKQKIQIISIENTFVNNIDTSTIFRKGVSGKSNHSGIGLWEVNKLVKKYDNIILNTSNDNIFFKQELQIHY